MSMTIEASFRFVKHATNHLERGLCMLQEVLRRLRTKLSRLAKTAEEFNSLTSETWALRIGAYINTAHWLSHSLQEAAGPLLLLDLEGKQFPASVQSTWCASIYMKQGIVESALC